MLRRDCADDPAARPPSPSDLPALARLCHAAWQGTVDDEGETVADWESRLSAYAAGEFGVPMWSVSEVSLARSFDPAGPLRAATLVGLWDGRPLVLFVATAPADRRQGLARAGLTRTINRLAAGDEPWVRLVLTEGNAAALRLYESLGFRREGPPLTEPT